MSFFIATPKDGHCNEYTIVEADTPALALEEIRKEFFDPYATKKKNIEIALFIPCGDTYPKVERFLSIPPLTEYPAPSQEYETAKAKVMADLDAAGWGFAISEWSRAVGERLTINSESGGHAKTGRNPYVYYPWDTDKAARNKYFKLYDCSVLKEVIAIADKHGAYFENDTTAETRLFLI